LLALTLLVFFLARPSWLAPAEVLLIVLFVGFVIGWRRLIWPRWYSRQFKQPNDPAFAFEADMTEAGFAWRSEFASASLAWSQFRRWNENGFEVALYASQGTLYLLPKRLFQPDGLDFLREQLRRAEVPGPRTIPVSWRNALVAVLVLVALAVVAYSYAQVRR
jgi:hypothetical protein